MSGSSYCPRSAVYVHGTAPFSRIHATATDVSRPPEKAIPTRSPTGREASTLVMDEIICTPLHDHATRSRRRHRPAHRFFLLSQDGPPSVIALGATGPLDVARGATRPERAPRRPPAVPR